MPATEEDVFSAMQRELRYESNLDEARALLESADYDRALAATQEARRFLSPGQSPSELDAIAGTIRSRKEQLERDRREQAERKRQQLAKEAEDKANAERIAREMAEQRRLEEEAHEKTRKTIISWVVGIIVVLLLIAIMGPGLFFSILLGGIALIFVIAFFLA